MKNGLYLILAAGLCLFLVNFVLNSSADNESFSEELVSDGSISMTQTNLSASEERKIANDSISPAKHEQGKVLKGPLPQNVPSEIKTRLSHHLSFEDDMYYETQLNLDGRPLEDYYFKWKKEEDSQPIAGPMPEIDSVKGHFPSEKEIMSIVEAAAERNTEILSVKEVWSLSHQKVLYPSAKVQVQTQARHERSNGHEIWFINLNTGKIVKRVDADRN